MPWCGVRSTSVTFDFHIEEKNCKRCGSDTFWQISNFAKSSLDWEDYHQNHETINNRGRFPKEHENMPLLCKYISINYSLHFLGSVVGLFAIECLKMSAA